MLKVEFKQIENVVLMKVIEQGKEIELGHGDFFNHNGITLCSRGYPSICTDMLFVKGASNFNQDGYASYSFRTSELAEEYIAKFNEVINAYNESVKENDLLWNPKENEQYYCIDWSCNSLSLNLNVKNDFDKDIIKNFGAFKSEEQAEKVRKHIILINLLWQLKFALCPDYEFNKELPYNSFIKFNRESEMFDYAFVSGGYDFATPVFDDKSVEKAVKYLNSHKELWENLL